MKNMPGKKHNGFTLIELLLAMAIAAIIVPGVITLFAQTNSYQRNITNHTTAVNQIKNAVNWITKDTQMAGVVTTTDPEYFLKLNWTEYPTSDNVMVIYTLIDGLLQRNYFRDNVLISTMDVARDLNPDTTNTDWNALYNILTTNLTVTIGQSSDSRTFAVSPRIIQNFATGVSTANSLSLVSDINPCIIGQPVTFTARISPAVATGTITFQDGGNVLGNVDLSAGQAQCVATFAAVGSHLITADYSGNPYFNATSATWVQTVGAAGIPTVTNVSPNSGPVAGGTTVTITGTNFESGVTAVKFGTADADVFTVNTSTRITAISPAASAGTVDVTVTNSSGTSAVSSADEFTYKVLPTVLSIAPASGTTSGGTSVVITGVNFTNVTGVTFGGTIATSYIVNSDTQITAVTPVSAGGAAAVMVITTAGYSNTDVMFYYYGLATKLAFTIQPSGATGSGLQFPIQPVVTVQDAGGNTVANSTILVTITKGTGSPSGTLSGDNTKNAVNGIATFTDLRINGTGIGYTLTAAATGLTSATSSPFNITSPAKLAFTTQPSGATGAGTVFPTQPVVTVQDASGNTVTASSASITIAIGTNPGGAGTILSGTTAINAVYGVAAFTGLSINNLGTGYTLTAASPGLTSATSSPFNVTGAATSLAFTTQPSGATGGTAFSTQPRVTIQDTSGQTVTGSNASITIAITSGTGTSGATLAGTTTISAVNGVATFSDLSINLIGTGYTLTATGSGLVSATSSPFNVTVGTASKLAFTTQPSGATSINTVFPIQPVVTVQDAGGNTVTNSTILVTITIGTNAGGSGTTLGGDNTKNAVNGIATFTDLRINRLGIGYTLTAAATGLTAATSSPFNITGATKLVFSTQPSGASSAGAVFPTQPVVTVQDASGNTVTASSVPITIAIGTNPASGTLSGTTTINALYGVAAFTDLSINNPGTGYTLTAASPGLTGATSSPFNISDAAVRLVFTTQPFNATAGLPFVSQPVVTVQDASGNTVTASNASIKVAITSGTGTSGATLAGNSTINAVNGVATFTNLSINLVGTGYSLRATSSGLAIATSNAFDVVPNTGYQLAFTTQPSGATGGTAFTVQPVVTVQDSSGNTVTDSHVSITMAIGNNPASGTLSGTATVAAVNGIATFTGLRIDKAGNGYTLMASSPGLASSFSRDFSVIAGPPTQVRVETAANGSGTVVPAQNVNSGSSITVYAVSRDAGGNFVANASGTWSLTNITGGVLSSDLAPSSGSSSTFTGNIAGSARIHVVSGSLTSVDSGTITVVDTTAPTGSLSINSGAAYTSSTSVTLNLAATDAIGVTGYRLDNDSNASNSSTTYITSTTSFSADIAWNLTSSNGTKTVAVQYRDAAGNWSSNYTDTIVLDNTAPAGSLNINSGAASTNSTGVTLNLNATDAVGVTGYRVANGSSASGASTITVTSTTNFSANIAWTLTSGDGSKTVAVQYRDAVGNWSNNYTDTITLDATAPTTASVTTPSNGSVYTTVPSPFSGSAADNSGGAGLNANSTTFTLQRSSNSQYWNGSTWQVSAYALGTTHVATTSNTVAGWTDSITLPTLASGTYTVQATATDRAGNSFVGTAVTFSYVATTTIELNPSAAIDTTSGSSNTLSSTERGYLVTSNNQRYQTDSSWDSNSFNPAEYLQFSFAAGIPSGSTIDSVALYFEWQRQSDIDGAQLLISGNNGSSWTTYTITPLPGSGNDSTISVDLITNGSINTYSEVNNLIIRFQASRDNSGSNRYTSHDWVEVNVTYH
jgi:prepilin-type N-terminal cleavage/methylation domain-containing protein